MKKQFLFASLISTLLLSIVLISTSSAESPISGLEDQASNINEKVNNIPRSQEDIKNEIRNKYLKEDWSEFMSKIKIIGQVHNFFIANPLIFQILLNEKYGFSLTFFGISILWIFFFILIYNTLKYLLPSKSAILALSGISCIIISHLGVINFIVHFIFHIIYAQETWWIRVFLWLFVGIILFLIFNTNKIFSTIMKQLKKSKEKTKIEQKIAESEAFIEGAKEGKKIVDDLKK